MGGRLLVILIAREQNKILKLESTIKTKLESTIKTKLESTIKTVKPWTVSNNYRARGEQTTMKRTCNQTTTTV